MNILGFNISIAKKASKKEEPRITPKNVKTVVPVNGRESEPHTGNTDVFANLTRQLEFVKPDFPIDCIPLIRKLYKINSDVGQVLYDLIQLTNTGHKIEFEQSVKPDLQDKMREHLENASKVWGQGTAGIDGLVNKLIAQIYITGALSAENVVKMDLSGLDYVALVNPETIRFAQKKGKYIPYQKAKRLFGVKEDYIELNPNTYKYYGLISDEDTPYGIPPFLTALEDISMQKDMKQNIKHILNQLGLLGYLEVKLDKPGINANEPEPQYANRLSSLLSQTKRNILKGFKEGVVVGFQEDHEFEFHSTSKNLTGVKELFDLNENQIANGLKTSATFIGVRDGSSEGFTSIVFTKMLSQLKNVQDLIGEFLESAYKLELALNGFEYKTLKVVFKASTITDEMKHQQAIEVKQRILHNLWVDRIISSEQYADEMGYKKPHKIIQPPDPGANQSDKQKKKEDREKGKDASDRRVREKNNPQPKRKDTK